MGLKHFFMKLRAPFLRFSKKKETVRVESDLQNLGDGYFREIGQYFKTAQMILLVVLVLFVSVFAVTKSELITYGNLYYFIKDFRTAVDHTDAGGESIPYEVDMSQSFAAYKGGIAVAGNARLQLLTASGSVNAVSELGFREPKLSATTSKLLVYERGGTSCHLYNSFTKIHSQVEDGNIRTAHLSESGAYVVVCEDDRYLSSVYLYNRFFERVSRHDLQSYVISAALNDAGNTVAILSFTCENGVYTTRLRLAEVGSDRIYCDYTAENEFPLGVSFFGNGRAVVVTDSAVHAVNKQGGEEIYSLSEGVLTGFSLSGNDIALVTKTEENASSSLLRVIDAYGEILLEHPVMCQVRDVIGCGEYVFYRTDRELIRVRSSGGDPLFCRCEAEGAMVALSEDRILICGSGEALSFLPEKAK